MLHRLAACGVRLRLSSEPPPGYVAFVERHLPALRSDSADVVGGDRNADRLYPYVLGDVAVWWRELEMLRMLGMRRAAEQYLSWAFQWRVKGWRSEEEARQVSVEVLGPEAAMQVWFGPAEPDPQATVSADAQSQALAPAGFAPMPVDSPWPMAVGSEPMRPPPVRPRPVRSNLALRLARFTPAPIVEFGPLLEARIAWLHAYQKRRRCWLIVKLAVVIAAFLTLASVGRG